MTTHKIITIGRQFGSGGHEIGNLLATRLDIPLYDNNLVRMAAEKMDIREETAKAIDETSLNSFVSSYLITPMGYSSYINSEEYVQPLSEQMYELQTEIIKKLAERGPCVIVGRCADYILKDNPNCINVFICADRADRIKRIAERYDGIQISRKCRYQCLTFTCLHLCNTSLMQDNTTDNLYSVMLHAKHTACCLTYGRIRFRKQIVKKFPSTIVCSVLNYFKITRPPTA